MSAIDIFDKAIRELYRGDGGRLSSYDEGWNDGVEAAMKALSSENAALRHNIERVTQRNSDLIAEVEQHKASLPTCEKHKPDRGARSGCVICSGEKLSNALSRIDYACGEPNEMECSDYAVHYNEDEVVKRVQQLRAEVEALRDIKGDA